MNVRTGLAVIVVALILTPVAGATTMPYWWWTNTKASRAVVAKNFQLGTNPDGGHSTITAAKCAGQGLSRRIGRIRYFRKFDCAVTWNYDTPDPRLPGPFHSFLLCYTTKGKPLGLRCQRTG